MVGSSGEDVRFLSASARHGAAIVAAICTPFSPAGCSRDQADPEVSAPAPAASADDVLGRIDAAFSQMNYGQAAVLASSGQQAFPGNARIHIAAAKAQARLGDAEASASALERARDAGMSSLAEALADPAFDHVRNHRAFARFHTSTRAASLPASTPRKSESRIRAGDVEIIEGTGGDYVRAGDIVLDTRQ